MSGLVVSRLTKSFGATHVLSDISFELAPHELLVLLGSSGCGKSTLLRIIAGLETADSGEIHLNGKRIDQLHPRERDVALVFQNYSLYPHMTVEQNIGFPLRIAGMPKTKRHQKVVETAKLLGLENRLTAKPAELSGGQRQRVALGRAIVREPALFLLDEPLSNLDTELRLRMRTEIVRLQRSLGRPAVHVTHDQSEAMAMADRIALMKDGTIVQLGTPEQLYNQPSTLFAATFLGHPRINIIPSHWENGHLHPLNIPFPENSPLRKHSEVILAIRPQHIRLDGDSGLGAEVIALEYVGEGHHVTLKTPDATLIASVHRQTPAVGEWVRVSFDSTAIRFFDPASGNRII